ncbi:MAG TPA: cytochrome c biogenesis protein ResB, partial [Candidatus Hydrogenedentes bacterium]|nr:cytochrome c biogenesis protein ResB [Candidatus Hydrogenedentota bacterium]
NMGPAAKIRVHSPDGDLQFWIFQHIESLRRTYPEVFDSMSVLNPGAFKPFVFALEGLHSRYYTGLQVMREPGVFWVGLGAVLMMIGFMMVFFYPQRQIWVVLRRTDQGTVIRIAGSSRRDPAGLQKELNFITNELSV